ncbi:MAG TPA: proton-conducting transporter membrane subunit [Anaerohalosphaeraceae bacterium]|nr:proton-conducting transporter membrane subunit [Anaerohalosphaeraceae bacterium]
MSVWMILAAIAVLGFGGFPACLFSSRRAAGQKLTTLLMLLGSGLGLSGVVMSLGESTTASMCAAWFLPWGRFAVAIDPLSVLFLLPVFVVPALGSIYGLGYWKQSEHPANGRRLGLFYGLLAGAMALVTISRDGVLFLVAWEVMAIAAYFAATAEDDNPEVRRAGWVYLIATHVGTLCLIAMFALWNQATSSFALSPTQGVSSELAGALFILAVIGFGFKAGLMPLHVWLPGAHANAPSHVSAVMSGVMLKMGVYGIVRMTALLPAPEMWWGGVLLAVGAVTGIAGIAFAIGQHDLKRLLAYSSIENIGIIAMGLGLALLGRTQNRPDWVLLGLGGALLHVWNHSLFKSLLFFNAGAIIHAAHTRDINRLGGLTRHMPLVMGLFVIGAVAICALPPLNGFASEWLLYVGLFRTLGSDVQAGCPAAALAAVALAMIGALAVACFVKLLSAVFLGSPRHPLPEHLHPASASMTIPMLLLAGGCAVIGLFPMLTAGLLEKAIGTWMTLPVAVDSITAIAPLNWITLLGLALIILVGLITLIVRFLPMSTVIREVGTWDCGYSRPTARIQYTGSSLGQMLVRLFAIFLWPKTEGPTLQGVFSGATRFKSLVPDTVLDRLVVPVFNLAGRYLPWLRIMQQGQTHLYVLYIIVIVMILMIWGAYGN